MYLGNISYLDEGGKALQTVQCGQTIVVCCEGGHIFACTGNLSHVTDTSPYARGKVRGYSSRVGEGGGEEGINT